MLRTRFSFACSVAALTISAIPAHAQSAPASPAPAAAMPASGVFNTRINDIQVARDGETVSILVKLSQQPGAATVKSTGETLVLEVDGLLFNTLNLSPPAGSLVTRVEAGSGRMTLSGVAFSNPTTVIYRNAIMIEAKLAEPKLQAATSLMGATVSPAPQPLAAVSPPPAPVPAPVPVKAVQPVAPLVTPPPAATPAPAPAPVKAVTPPVTPAPIPVQPPAPQAAPTPAPEPAPIVPVHPATSTPIKPEPIALAPAETTPHPKHEAEDQLQSHPAPAPVSEATAPVAPKHAAPAAAPAPTPTASMAGIDAARCATAADELAKDAWALAAMGDHALCLIDAGKLDEAKNRLDQLAAITPQDWRVSLGRATLAEKAGDMETAQAAFVSASLAAPTDDIRTAITERVSATPDDKETDIEIPLPTTPLAAPAPAPKAAH